jgi:hypothetical protein
MFVPEEWYLIYLVRPFARMKTFIVLIATVIAAAAQWPQPKSPAIPQADGYVEIPNVALPPTKERKYQAIFDATRSPDKPSLLMPALNMAASDVNALAAVKAPPSNTKFAVVFHGPAVDGILDNDHYKAKFATDNPDFLSVAALCEPNLLLSQDLSPAFLLTASLRCGFDVGS